MIETKEAVLTKMIVNHFDTQGEFCQVGEGLTLFTTDEEIELRKILLKAFEGQTITYEFDHPINIDYNVLFGLIKKEYAETNFIEFSKQVMNHLTDASDHPNIKSGDVFITRFEDIKLGNTYCDAIGILKFEDKQSFMETYSDNGMPTVELKKGIGNRKPEKACLVILNDEPYTILVIDNGKGGDTEYWQEDFIKHRPKSDDANRTHNFLNMTKAFIVDELPNDFEVGRADQIDMLNRSVDFFKSNDTFELAEFENQVITQPEVVESFDRFKSKFQRETEMEISDDFHISKPVLKKQARAFKSVLKLDKNFHVYIHGNRNLIEQGVDEQGRKFYRLFYEEEH